jgi:hypothetical protein
MSNPLDKARAELAAIDASIAEVSQQQHGVQQEIAVLQATLAKFSSRKTNCYAARALAETKLAQEEESALAQMAIVLAGEIITRNSSDPVGHQAWIIENVLKLQTMIRGELDSPRDPATGKIQHSVPPLVMQALSLVPPPDPINKPVYQLPGGVVAGISDWASRRRRILADATSNPHQAA